MPHPPSAHRPQTLQSEQKPRDQARIQIEAPHRPINTHPKEIQITLHEEEEQAVAAPINGGRKKRRNKRVHEMGKESQASEREPKESDREPRQEQA